MNHLKWMGHTSTLMEINQSLRDDAASCEVTLVAKDGCTVRAHRFVLSTCSDLMRNVLVDVPQGQECTIMLPEINGSLLDSMLSFIYVGETNLPSSSLTEFLEAINLLGIKSAISFECSAASLSASGVAIGEGSAEGTMDVKAISGLQITQEELLEEDGVEKLVVSNVMEQQQASAPREMEFLDVYSEQPKITYSIEHMSGTGGGGEFILTTDNANTFTLTQAQAGDKLADAASSVVEGGELVEDNDVCEDVDGSNIIEEEYNSGGEPLMDLSGTDVEMSDAADTDMAHVESGEADAQMIAAARAAVKIRTMKAKRDQKHTRGEGTTKKRIRTKNPIEVDNLELAAHAVLTEGLSLQKAADKYDISKTVLWRRMRKDPDYAKTGRERPALALAYERLKKGDSLKNISKDLDIPMSTLHRHKVRLSEEGRLPQFVACRRRDSTPKDELNEKLAKAVHACVHEGMSQNHAATIFEIAKSTLWRHLRRRLAEAEQSMEESEEIKEEVI